MELKKYITYEEPLEGKSFTINQLHEVYRDLVDKETIILIRWFGNEPLKRSQMISNQKATIMFLMSVFGSLFFIGKILKIE